MALIRDPCLRGPVELQNSEVIFYMRPVQVKRYFFLTSRLWQAAWGLIKPAGTACTHFPNRFSADPELTRAACWPLPARSPPDDRRPAPDPRGLAPDDRALTADDQPSRRPTTGPRRPAPDNRRPAPTTDNQPPTTDDWPPTTDDRPRRPTTGPRRP